MATAADLTATARALLQTNLACPLGARRARLRATGVTEKEEALLQWARYEQWLQAQRDDWLAYRRTRSSLSAPARFGVRPRSDAPRRPALLPCCAPALPPSHPPDVVCSSPRTEAAQPDRTPQVAEADAIDQQVDELKEALLRRAADLARTREYLARCVRRRACHLHGP